MIKPNWKIFAAKFSDNTQSNFEWFSYLLFCQEFNQRFGIFRYKNQSAIETSPIEFQGEIIGWQAKYYEDSISKNKDELLETIEKAKRDYPTIQKIVLYSNQDWGQAKGKKPKGLIEIEAKAESLNIKLIWKTSSFFESAFVASENETIAKHFFCFETSIFDVIKKQQTHSKTLLSTIHAQIEFNSQIIEIDRSNSFKKLTEESLKISIVSGVGGVGKTGLIKKFFGISEEHIPFFIFKATEFELSNADAIFSGCTVTEFSQAHKDEIYKVVVIDSAEKLLDLKNSEPFKEFLKILIDDGWRIIFTTRNNYLENLNFQFCEIYGIFPVNLSVDILEINELSSIADKYSFQLPSDLKLLELIRNPFYLNQYLKYYSHKDQLNYAAFKEKLWDINVKKSNPSRETCFLKLALQRANEGQFFVTPECDSIILDGELVKDGVLGHESAGYFITHDIYEEWALEKIIGIAFSKRNSNQKFFDEIGQSLPIRRCFRVWLSEMLQFDESIKDFIEDIVRDEEIKSHWKDEIIVSVLLSDYADIFFNIFKSDLLSNGQAPLKKIALFLRMACKEIDNELLKQVGYKSTHLFSLHYVFTKPKGHGWKAVIRFVFDNLDAIGIQNIGFILPIIHDWNNKFKTGQTTLLASSIALKYYVWSFSEKRNSVRGEKQDQLFGTIAHGASEISTELTSLIEKIIKNNWRTYKDPYFDFSKYILTKMEAAPLCSAIPNSVLQLASLFWTSPSKQVKSTYYSRQKIESAFGVEQDSHEYFPPSAYQTPIYLLLKTNTLATIDFILDFTNTAIESYSQSNIDNSVIKVNVWIDENTCVDQYFSQGLWLMYRGTSSPVSPNLLQSIHMALEKFLLDIGRTEDSKTLETCLIHLLKNSKSASISAIVASIVLAYPENTLNIAKILFKTKEFILNDTVRMANEQSATSLYSISFGLGNWKDDLYREERLKTCKDKHRSTSLEQIFLSMQFFASSKTDEAKASEIQKSLWEILDTYYSGLPPTLKQNSSDKTWRIFLARMDRRKMEVSSEKTDSGVLIKLSPTLDNELKEYSESVTRGSSEPWDYSSLKIWAESKLNFENIHQNSNIYENDPLIALTHVKEILDKLEDSKNDFFRSFNKSIPIYVCSVLLRDYLDDLAENATFCKNVVLDFISQSLKLDYRYEISEGIKPAISILPILVARFPEEKAQIKLFLLRSLLNESYSSTFGNRQIRTAIVHAVKQLRRINIDDARSIFFGYLFFKPKYDELCQLRYQENLKGDDSDFFPENMLERLFSENSTASQQFANNTLLMQEIDVIKNYALDILGTTFELLPQEVISDQDKEIAKTIISVFVKELTSDEQDDQSDYKVTQAFLENYAHFILNSDAKEIQNFLAPVIDCCGNFKALSNLFNDFISVQDQLNKYENFWIVWNSFKHKLFLISKNDKEKKYFNKIFKNFLFAGIQWRENIKEWHSLKGEDRRFFKEISDEFGQYPSVLYSISKLLDGIGSIYLDDGLVWISNILEKNENYERMELEVYTVHYIENFVRKYVFKHREQIRKTKLLRDRLLIILDFLVKRESTVGYMVRENIL